MHRRNGRRVTADTTNVHDHNQHTRLEFNAGSKEKTMKPLCRHCQKVKSNRPRGLCWSCYYTPGVREQFPSTSKFARRGVADFNGRATLPEPTEALPGSLEKVHVLEERARLGQQLWHPLDAKLDRRRLAEREAEEEVRELSIAS